MNRLFHKHGRLAFGLLTLFIIVPFVLYFSVAPEEILNMFSFSTAKSNISINGTRVPQKEFDESMKSLMISMSTQGWPVDFNSTSIYQQLTPGVVDRIILMDEIEKLKISADDSAIASYMKALPMFQDSNGFSYDRYKMVCYALGRYGISQNQIETSLREDATIGILKRMISDGVITTENGMQDFYNNLNQSFSVKVAEFNSKDYLSKVSVKDKDIQTFFDSNPTKYMTPKKSKAYIVKFDFSVFENDAKKNITEEQLNKLYEMKKASYGAMNEKEAKEKIKEQLIDEACANAAKQKAQEFAISAYKAIEDKGQLASNAITLFEDIAIKNKLETYKTSSWISDNSDLVENIGKEPALVKEISALYPDQPISNAIEGKKAYFVALLTERSNPTKATLDDVKKKVTEDYKLVQSIKLAQQSASKFRDDSLKSDKKNIGEAKEFNKDYKFSQSSFASIMSDPNAKEIIELTTKTPQGQLSNVANNSDGAIIVYVEKISLPTKEDYEKNKEAIENQYNGALEQIAWMNYNLMLKNKANVLVYESSQK